MSCRIVSCRVVSCRVVSRRVVPWHGLAWHGLAWPGRAWHGMPWHGMEWHGRAWQGMAWHGMAWHGIACDSRVFHGHSLSGRGKEPSCQSSRSCIMYSICSDVLGLFLEPSWRSLPLCAARHAMPCHAMPCTSCYGMHGIL